jgi:hypothetical protein
LQPQEFYEGLALVQAQAGVLFERSISWRDYTAASIY